jgi:hypothetical protein
MAIILNPTPLSAPILCNPYLSTLSVSTVLIPFSSPASTGGLPIIKYVAISNPGGFTSSTNQTGIMSISGLSLGQSYTFTVTAYNGFGPGPSATTPSIVTTTPGSISYTLPGIYCFIPNTSTVSVSVVAIGAGGHGAGSWYNGGGGGGLGYRNNIAVTSGTNYRVVVGAPYPSCCNVRGYSGSSWFINSSTVVAGFGGQNGYGGCHQTSDYGTCGGVGGGWVGAGGGTGGKSAGGAGGYAGCGGRGFGYRHVTSGGYYYDTTAGTGGGGGGANVLQNGSAGLQAGGGGVGLYGQGCSGAAGLPGYYTGNNINGRPMYQVDGGGGGSGGTVGGSGNGYLNSCSVLVGASGNGGCYGGGGGGLRLGGPISTGVGAGGAVRIVWPGITRQFPSTCVGTP